MRKEQQPRIADIFPTRTLFRDVVRINEYLSVNSRAVSVAYYIVNDDIERILGNVQHFEDLASQGVLPKDEVKTRILQAHVPFFRQPAKLILRAAGFSETGNLNTPALNAVSADDPWFAARRALLQGISLEESMMRQDKRAAILEAEEILLLSRLGSMLEVGQDLEAIDYAADYLIVHNSLNPPKAQAVRRGQNRFHQLYNPRVNSQPPVV